MGNKKGQLKSTSYSIFSDGTRTNIVFIDEFFPYSNKENKKLVEESIERWEGIKKDED